MTIDATLLRILILLLPGLTGRLFFQRLKANSHRTAWQAFVEVFLFAFASYIVAGLLLSLVAPIASSDNSNRLLQVGSQNIDAIYKEDSQIDWPELYVAILVSVLVAILVAWVHNRKLMNRFGRWVGITQSFGDDDVWEYIHNSPDIDWVYLRDKRQGLTYYGQISSYSDSYQPREIMMSNVVAYDNTTGEELYIVDGVYLSRATEEITIEIPLYGSHLPDSLSTDEFARLQGSASSREHKVLNAVYEFSSESEAYVLAPKAKVRDRILLQNLLDRENLSVIHKSRGDKADE